MKTIIRRATMHTRALQFAVTCVCLFWGWTHPAIAGNQYDLGVAKGSALKMAIFLDQHEATCKKEGGRKWENLLDSTLRANWGDGTEQIFENTSMQMRIPIEQVKGHPVKEFLEAQHEYGGCKSARYKKFIDGVYRDYSDTLRMLNDKEWWSER